MTQIFLTNTSKNSKTARFILAGFLAIIFCCAVIVLFSTTSVSAQVLSPEVKLAQVDFDEDENDPFGGRPGGQAESEFDSNDSTFGMDKIGDLLNLPDVDLMTLIGNLINIALSLVGLILLLMLLYSGFLFMVSGSDEERRKKAKQTAISALIGVVIIFLAGTIVQFVFDALQNATGSGGQQDVPF